MAKIDFGPLTEDETKAIALEAMGQLGLDAQIEVVLTSIDKADWREIIAELESAGA
jgi:hypothetical protein